MELTAKAIADFLKGEIVGNPNVTVSNVAKIEEGKPGTLAFLSNPKYSKFLYTTNASIVLINKEFEVEGTVAATLIKVDNAYESFAKLLDLASSMQKKKVGIHPQAFIEPSAKIGDNAFIGAFVYIGEGVTIGNDVKIYAHCYIGDKTTIGNNCILYAGVKIYDSCAVGNNCIFHAGTVIGSDGFGFAPQADGSYQKIQQIGNVVIEDDVEIGANSAIDRATMGSTIIRKGVKLDNLIQIAHNVEIGENTAMAAQGGIAGSTKIGKGCLFGGQVGVAGHITVADGVRLSAKAGVTNNLKIPGEILIGAPAINAKIFSKSFIHFKNLPEMRAEIDVMKRKIEKMEQNLNQNQ
jgi:UDP-3-O-[3-hydroxymyristoyl] glucosamine N-acyltransferase